MELIGSFLPPSLIPLKEGMDVSVTLKLEDRDAKLVAVGLDSLAEWYLGLENSPV